MNLVASKHPRARVLGLVIALSAIAACDAEESAPATAEVDHALVVACVDAGEEPPPEIWACGEDLVVECDSHEGADVAVIHAVLPDLEVESTCDELQLAPSDEGPFGVGDHEIGVRDELSAETGPICVSTLTVVDTVPPKVGSGYLELWPPNHKLYWLAPEECAAHVFDRCDASPHVELTYATSDEFADQGGDGHTDEDIVDLGCDGVGLRAERDGSRDGRVYRVGFRVSDDAGNATEGECVVVVRHDQGDHDPVQGNVEAYRIELQGCPAG